MYMQKLQHRGWTFCNQSNLLMSCFTISLLIPDFSVMIDLVWLWPFKVVHVCTSYDEKIFPMVIKICSQVYQVQYCLFKVV